MASRRWLGNAKQVTQINTVTLAGTWLTGETVTLTVDGIDFVVTVGSLVTTSQVATTLKQAYAGESLTDTTASSSPTVADGGAGAIPQLAEMTATVSSSVVTLTANTSGKPFTMSISETSASGTAVLATPTVATGRHFRDNADNWSTNLVPLDGDDIIFDTGSVDLKYNLTTGIQPLSVTKTKGYTGRIGLPETNTDSSTKPYPEYRTKYLTFTNTLPGGYGTATRYDLEIGEGSGSQLVRIDAGAGLVTLNVYDKGTRLVTGQPTILFIGTNTSNTINVPKGDLGVAFFEGETAHVANLRVGDGTTAGATVYSGNGTDLVDAAIDVSGGTLTIESATSSGDIDISKAGTLTVLGTGAHSSIDVRDGTANYRSSGTLATLIVGSGGKFDRSADLRPATITNVVNMFKGAQLIDPHGVLTFSGGIKVNGTNFAGVTIDLGPDRTMSIT